MITETDPTPGAPPTPPVTAPARWRRRVSGRRSLAVALALAVMIAGVIAVTVTVTRPQAAATECGPAADYTCYEARYQRMVRDADVTLAFTAFRGDYRRSAVVRTGCHGLAHAIGRAAGERYGVVATAYGQGEEFCGSGYYHGTMEAIVVRTGAVGAFTDPDAFCADLGGHPRHAAHHRNCAHGLGHGFMGLVGHDLFRALAVCDRLTDPWEADHCHGGVFMQNVQDSDDPHHSMHATVRPAEPLYPCTAVDDRYKERCYERQTAYALRHSDLDFAGVFALCARVAGAFAATCDEGVGRSAAAYRIQSDTGWEQVTASAKAICDLGRGDVARGNCVVGVAETFVRYYHDDSHARGFCDVLVPAARTACLEHVARFYQEFTAR